MNVLKLFKSKPKPLAIDEKITWMDYNDDEQVFEFNDLLSCGVCYQIDAPDIESLDGEGIQALQSAYQSALLSLPMHEHNPYIVQFYSTDRAMTADDIKSKMRQSTDTEQQHSKIYQAWENEFSQFIDDSSSGLFIDPKTKKLWGPKVKKQYVLIYRLLDPKTKQDYLRSKLKPSDELKRDISTFSMIMEQAGCTLKKLDLRGFIEWIVPWLQPNPTGFDNAYDFLDNVKIPTQEQRSFNFDLINFIFRKIPDYDATANTVDTSGTYQRLLTLKPLATEPRPAHIAGDQKVGEIINTALLDRLPAGSTVAMTIVLQHRITTTEHINKVADSSGLASREAETTSNQRDDALNALANSEVICPLHIGIYIKAESTMSLDSMTTDVISTIGAEQLSAIDPKDDLVCISSFFNFLPFCYQYQYDRKDLHRTSITDSSYIAACLPTYGRCRGTDNCNNMQFNRSGELVKWDELEDKVLTAHELLFGPTGSGKSAFLVMKIMQRVAKSSMPLFVIEKGRSFALLAKYLRRMDVEVNEINFKAKGDLCVPPFLNAKEMLERLEDDIDATPVEIFVQLDEAKKKGSIEELNEEFVDEGQDDESRDYLGEMELITQIMIAGGDEREQKKITRQDVYCIQEVIISACKRVRDQGEYDYPIVSDMIDAFNEAVEQQKDTSRKRRIQEMSEALTLWTRGIRGKFFNRRGKTWDIKAVNIMDMGFLTNDANQDMLAVTLLTVLNQITSFGEVNQLKGAQMEVIIDEAHAIFKNTMLAYAFVFGAKTWRKLGIWLTLATQNLDEIKESASVLIKLVEWFVCLKLPKGDIDDLADLKTITPTQRKLLLSAKKEKHKYVEGVVLSEAFDGLFRSVQPPLSLALAQTDINEKKERAKIIEQHQLHHHDEPDLEAALIVAKAIRKARTERAFS